MEENRENRINLILLRFKVFVLWGYIKLFREWEYIFRIELFDLLFEYRIYWEDVERLEFLLFVGI